MEKKYTPFLISGIAVALLFTVLVFAKLNRHTSSAPETYNEVSPSADLAIDFDSHDYYLFSREGCPHCAQVESFLETNPEIHANLDMVTVKIDINDSRRREQYQQALADFAATCGLDTKTIGVPFLYRRDEQVPASQRCQVGDTPIIDYLSNQGT